MQHARLEARRAYKRVLAARVPQKPVVECRVYDLGAVLAARGQLVDERMVDRLGIGHLEPNEGERFGKVPLDRFFFGVPAFAAPLGFSHESTLARGFW